MTKVGILHSLRGTMAVSESALVDAAVMAIDEINQQGGVLGQRVEPIIEDGASDPLVFEQRARKLLSVDKADTIFGCWTSASRKAVKPVVEAAGSLLWYPVQYEGLEESAHIVYTGSCLNQQIEPAVGWMLQQGRRRCLLIGSDYVFPRTANLLIASMVERSGGTVLGDHYVPLGWREFAPIVGEIRKLRPEVVFNTLNGDSNYAFFRQLHSAGLRADEMPVMSFSIAEGEQQVIADEGEGHFACWSYFHTLDNAGNRGFIQRYRLRYGDDRRSSDPVVAAYSQVWLWRNAVEAAGSFNPRAVRWNLVGQHFVGPAGEFRIQPNHHLSKPALIGRARKDGLFDLVWRSDSVIEPKPWLGVEDLPLAGAPLIKESLRQLPQSFHYANILEAEISRRAQVEKRLQESENRFRSLVSHLPSGIYQMDQEGKCVYVNPRWCEMTGFTPEEAFGDGWILGVHPEDRDQVLASWNHMLASEERWVSEYRLLDKQGRITWISGTAVALRNANGNIAGYLGTNTDITDRKQAESERLAYREHLEELVGGRTTELMVAKERAEAANQAKSVFLANMSHELRTPLNAILGFAQLMARDERIPADERQNLETINRSGMHLLGMINDVLDLSKIEAGRVDLELVCFDLPRMLGDIGRMFEVRAGQAELRFELDFAPELARYISTDVGKLRQIFINLLSNAVKFTEEGGFALRVRTLPIAEDPTMVVLEFEIQDSGPGIPTEQLKHIFEPFVQVGPAPRAAKGTGLGLAISKSFVDLMGGDIAIDSAPGEGSMFRVKLPVALAESAEAAGVEPTERLVLGLEPGQPPWRILVVEDNPENRLLLDTLLRQVGFDTRESENGEEAITMFESWRPHLIWMDMRMPVMDGFEATRRIRTLPGGDTVKIVALTASVFKEQRRKILEAGCDEVVHKPFLIHDIFDAMAHHLGVRYRYQKVVEAPVSAPLKVNSKAVMALPRVLQERLLDAAVSLNEEDFDVALVWVRDLDPDLAMGLAALAKDFRFDRIVALLDGKDEDDK